MSIIIEVEVNDKSTHNGENETLELIASGYEWKCPACGQETTESEIKKKVRCKKCHRQFEVDNYAHAFE